MIGSWSDKYGRKPFLIIAFSTASLPLLVILCHLQFGLSMLFYFPAQASQHNSFTCWTDYLLRLHCDKIMGEMYFPDLQLLCHLQFGLCMLFHFPAQVSHPNSNECCMLDTKKTLCGRKNVHVRMLCIRPACLVCRPVYVAFTCARGSSPQHFKLVMVKIFASSAICCMVNLLTSAC